MVQVVGKGAFAQRHVPAHIRHVLQAESGALWCHLGFIVALSQRKRCVQRHHLSSHRPGSNDGAAFPFLYLALFLLLRETDSVGRTVGLWIALVLLYQIVLGVVIGAVVGIAARKLLKFSKRRRLIDRESMVAMYVALSLFVTGGTALAGSDVIFFGDAEERC